MHQKLALGESKAVQHLIAREAELRDRRDIWQWWNDPLTRKMMKQNECVAWEEHVSWFDNILVDEKRILCIGEVGEEKIGVVRFDYCAPGIYEVSINNNPNHRGKKYASPLLQKSIELLESKVELGKLFAKTKKTNIPSQKAFLGAGFTVVDAPAYEHRGLEDFSPDTEVCLEQFLVDGRNNNMSDRQRGRHV